MPLIDRYQPGTFNWFELVTTDRAAAKRFYADLFGWTTFDSPLDAGEVYTMFQLDGYDVAAAYTLQPAISASGVPSHWDIYVAVASVDEAAVRIESMGGSVIQKPIDAMARGRKAVAADPSGAEFCIWEKKSHMGAGIAAETGTVCWADLNTPDAEAAGRFYSEVFGWELYRGQNDTSGYLHIKNAGVHIGGIYPTLLPPNTPAHWMLYFSAADVKALSERASALGGTLLVPVTAVPETGKFCVVRDLQGAVFALFEAEARPDLIPASRGLLLA